MQTKEEYNLSVKLLKQGLKRCTKCLKIKNVSEFNAMSRNKCGLQPKCRVCNKLYRDVNKKILAEKKKIYYKENKVIRSQYNKAYREKNKEAIAKQHKEYNTKNRELIRRKDREYRNTRKEHIINYGKKYRKINKKRLSACKKKYKESYCTSKEFINKINNKDYNYTALFRNNKIIVLCYNCKAVYSPTNLEVISFLKTPKGYSNIYCSGKCKQACKVFNFKPSMVDPDSKLYIPKAEQQQARSCQTGHLKQLQPDEFGYNYCEICGEEVKVVELHHTLEVAKFGVEAVNSAGHILLCNTCHKKLTKQCNK